MSKTFRKICRWLAFLSPFLVAMVAWAQNPIHKSGGKWQYQAICKTRTMTNTHIHSSTSSTSELPTGAPSQL